MTSIEHDVTVARLSDSERPIHSIEELVSAAEALSADDRLRLISRLWETLPPEHWAAPSPGELVEIKRRLGETRAHLPVVVPQGLLERVKTLTAPGGPELYSAPRRFDLATIFVVTAAYSLLFTGLTLLDAHPVAMLIIGAFITTVGVGQAFLINVFNPRASSMIVGAVCSLVLWLYWWILLDRPLPVLVPIFMLFAVPVVGSVLGYLAGVLVGGVFLVADVARKTYTKYLETISDAPSEAD